MSIKKKSIIRKILFSMIIALIVEAAIFGGMILNSGILKDFADDSFSMLNHKVDTKALNLKNKIINNINNINKSQEEINSIILKMLSDKKITTNELNSNDEISVQILNDISKNLVSIIKNNNVTGAFIILNTTEDEKENIEKKGLYIRDLNQKICDKDNIDLSIEIGPESVSSKLKINKDSDWKSNFRLDDIEAKDKKDFFYKQINMAEKYKNVEYKELGYWSKPFKLVDNDLEVIRYSIPLIDQKGNCYGIIGIDNSVDIINENFYQKEEDSYILAVNDEENMSFKSIISVGKIAKDIGENVKFNPEQINHDTYELKQDKNIKNKICGCIKNIDLYNLKTPFESEKWVVIGLIPKDDILYNIHRLNYCLLISLITSILIGTIFAFMLGHKITKPIINLSKKVKQTDPKKQLLLEKINISEIDDLSLAITNLSIKVQDSASKLSQIINLLNMPIGAFEYKEDEEVVFCTKGFFDVLEIDNVYIENSYIDRAIFDLIMQKLLDDSKLESYEVTICKIKDSKQNEKWIRLKFKEENLKVFGVITDITQEVLEKRKIKYDRDHDILTNLLNRRAFRKEVKHKFKEGNLGIGALVMLDLDNLKYVNDTYGHDCGDEYIKEAARVLKEFNNYNAIVSRKSGDEFFVFIYGYSDKNQIRKIVNEIHEKMKNTIYVISKNKELKIRASVGISWYPDDSTNYNELSRYSDFAMYKIKHTVKGAISEFNKDEYNKESFLFKDMEELNKLIEQELVQYAFQPIVDIHTGEIYAYEALMRSNLETMKSPAQIIKLATAESKLYQIEKLTWFKALEAFVAHKEEFGRAKVFINSIPNYVLTDKDFKEFKELYGKYTDNLVIEFLENERSNSQSTAKKLNLIQSINAKLAIDDFGSGYNNEAILLDISPDFVKIDTEIVRGIDTDLNRQQISKNLISYAKGRNIKVIAEGVETKKELEKLVELGIDYVQGYYLSKPAFNPPKLDDKLVEEIKKLAVNDK